MCLDIANTTLHIHIYIYIYTDIAKISTQLLHVHLFPLPWLAPRPKLARTSAGATRVPPGCSNAALARSSRSATWRHQGPLIGWIGAIGIVMLAHSCWLIWGIPRIREIYGKCIPKYYEPSSFWRDDVAGFEHCSLVFLNRPEVIPWGLWHQAHGQAAVFNPQDCVPGTRWDDVGGMLRKWDTLLGEFWISNGSWSSWATAKCQFFWELAKDGESITASPCDFQDFEAETGRDLSENG